jgi:hypothetical protein
MTVHRILAFLLCVPAAAVAQKNAPQPTVCISIQEFDSLGAGMLRRIARYTEPADAAYDEYRRGYGYPLVPASQLSLVTQESVCKKAAAAYRSATTGAGWLGRVAVVKAGTTYTVIDPGYYYDAANKAALWVLLDSKFKPIRNIQG